MTWHTQTVAAEALASLLARIKAMGGTVAHSRPGLGGVQVTWTTRTSDITLKAPSNGTLRGERPVAHLA
jgi:hypothetical protein